MKETDIMVATITGDLDKLKIVYSKDKFFSDNYIDDRNIRSN